MTDPENENQVTSLEMRRIESGLNVPPLLDFAAGAVGATRFIDCGEDSPDQVLSCAWYRDGVCVESVVGFPAVADEMPLGWSVWLRIECSHDLSGSGLMH